MNWRNSIWLTYLVVIFVHNTLNLSGSLKDWLIKFQKQRFFLNSPCIKLAEEATSLQHNSVHKFE